MASKSARLRITLTPRAKADLNQIWAWNAKDKSPEKADAYDKFLIRQIHKLEMDYALGRPLNVAPECRYITVKKSKRGHGHHVIFQIHQNTVEILRIFHTRQDWENRFTAGR
jgi:plasmid stabilization system protein ParE